MLHDMKFRTNTYWNSVLHVCRYILCVYKKNLNLDRIRMTTKQYDCVVLPGLIMMFSRFNYLSLNLVGIVIGFISQQWFSVFIEFEYKRLYRCSNISSVPIP